MIASADDINKPLVSISVPIYNVAAYIEQCARSLFEQTYSNLEYVFVNDATPDNSMDILRRVAQDYPHRLSQIRYLNNDLNHGLAYTRTRSIKEAKGTYICCVDSDDWVEHDMVSQLVEKALSSGAEMVELGSPVTSNYSFAEVLQDLPCNNIWGKLFHRSLFSDKTIFAPEGLDYMEDRHVLTRLRYKVKNVANLDMQLYHYRLNRVGSVATAKTAQHIHCMIRFYQELEKWMKQKGILDYYSQVLAEQKVRDKIRLLMACQDKTVDYVYADLYREEETIYMSRLHRSQWLFAHLLHLHYWHLISLYRYYIKLRITCAS